MEAPSNFIERLLDMEPELVEGGSDAFTDEDFEDTDAAATDDE